MRPCHLSGTMEQVIASYFQTDFGQFVLDASAGTIGAIAGVLCGSPFDVIKVGCFAPGLQIPTYLSVYPLVGWVAADSCTERSERHPCFDHLARDVEGRRRQRPLEGLYCFCDWAGESRRINSPLTSAFVAHAPRAATRPQLISSCLACMARRSAHSIGSMHQGCLALRPSTAGFSTCTSQGPLQASRNRWLRPPLST